MTVKEIKKSVKKMKNFSKQTAQSKTKAKDFLVKTGIYTPQGKLTKAYK